MSTATATKQAAEHICPIHPQTRLVYVLAGGSGYCTVCRCYQQSANHPMPALDPHVAAKRAEQSKARTTKKAKPKKQVKAKRQARHQRAGGAERARTLADCLSTASAIAEGRVTNN